MHMIGHDDKDIDLNYGEPVREIDPPTLDHVARGRGCQQQPAILHTYRDEVSTGLRIAPGDTMG